MDLRCLTLRNKSNRIIPEAEFYVMHLLALIHGANTGAWRRFTIRRKNGPRLAFHFMTADTKYGRNELLQAGELTPAQRKII